MLYEKFFVKWQMQVLELSQLFQTELSAHKKKKFGEFSGWVDMRCSFSFVGFILPLAKIFLHNTFINASETI
jgi:hypothetical protein